MHNSWLRIIGGRLKSDYSYSPSVYNNFPWPDLPADSEPNQPPAPAHKAQAAIEIAAQAVLDARAQFPGSSLADLYDPLTMPPALLRAHQKLDAAVDKAYQLCGGKKSYASDAERVAFLFERYQQLTSLLPVAAGKKKAPKPRSSAGTGTGIDTSTGSAPDTLNAAETGKEAGEEAGEAMAAQPNV